MPRKLFAKGESGNPKGRPVNKPGEPPVISKKRKARMKVQDILDMLDFRPFEEMVALYRHTNKERVKAEILMDLCSYIAPKLKHVELSGDKENPFVINLNLQPGKKRLEFNNVIDEIVDDDDD